MSSTITQLLQGWTAGDEQAMERLIPLVYDHLRLIAVRQLKQESEITLQPTELVHEAFLRLQKNHGQEFQNRIHFYGAAAEAMRRILIDLARRKVAAKRSGRRTGQTAGRLRGREAPTVCGACFCGRVWRCGRWGSRC